MYENMYTNICIEIRNFREFTCSLVFHLTCKLSLFAKWSLIEHKSNQNSEERKQNTDTKKKFRNHVRIML